MLQAGPITYSIKYTCKATCSKVVSGEGYTLTLAQPEPKGFKEHFEEHSKEYFEEHFRNNFAQPKTSLQLSLSAIYEETTASDTRSMKEYEKLGIQVWREYYHTSQKRQTWKNSEVAKLGESDTIESKWEWTLGKDHQHCVWHKIEKQCALYVQDQEDDKHYFYQNGLTEQKIIGQVRAGDQMRTLIGPCCRAPHSHTKFT